MSAVGKAGLLRFAILGVVAMWLPHHASAQTVVEVQGGGSSLVDGYGVTANFWRSGVDGWIGLGYLNGLRAGAFLRTAVNKDTLRLGNDALVMRLPTDVFTPGYNVLVQGVSYAGGSDRTSFLAFGGASSAGVGAPSFQPVNIEKPMGAIFFQHRAAPSGSPPAPSLPATRQCCRVWSGSQLVMSLPASSPEWARDDHMPPPASHCAKEGLV